MKILETNITDQIKHIHLLKEGPAYVFDNFLVTEFEEGATIDYQCFKAIYHLLDTYSQGNSQFSFLSNRVHSYAVKAADFLIVEQEREGALRYKSAVISYDPTGHRMFSFEKKLYKCDTKLFFGLDKAIHWAAPNLITAC